MAEQKVLTAEQVYEKCRHILGRLESGMDHRSTEADLDAVVYSYTTLSRQDATKAELIQQLTEQLAEAQTQLAYEQERGLNNRLGWDLEMQDTVADVRALADVLQQANFECFHNYSPDICHICVMRVATEAVLARPGVQRVLAEGRPTA